MATPARARKSAAIAAIAACAAIGATSPVWADSGSSSSPAPSGDQTTSADSATVAALQAQIAQLRTTLASDEAALHRAIRADHASGRAARSAMAAADKWKKKSEHVKTRIVKVDVPVSTGTPTTDPAKSGPCHHGMDPGDWKGHRHDGSHGQDFHHFHHGGGFKH
jgi:phage I-like protein